MEAEMAILNRVVQAKDTLVTHGAAGCLNVSDVWDMCGVCGAMFVTCCVVSCLTCDVRGVMFFDACDVLCCVTSCLWSVVQHPA